VYAEGEAVTLTLKEYEMLRVMLEHPASFSPATSSSPTSGEWITTGRRDGDVHMRTLRQKIGDCGDLIETVRGVGYRLVAKL
jgi:two-component system alkaline phosphatase synthesis response regulator PhoP